MMAHLPLFAHPNPQNVLVVGGGDGIILREVCRHHEVKTITLVEIDRMVIQASKEHFNLAPTEVFEDARLDIVHADAAEYLKDPSQQNKYDVIIADTLDPLGPAESLFEPEFYESMHSSLRDGGVICTQGENMWIHLELIKDLISCCADIFGYAEYAITSVPSYPCGQIGFILARKGEPISCRRPTRSPTFQQALRWYNPQMHRAAFVLPQYVKEELEPLNRWNDAGEDAEENEECFLGRCVIL